MSVESNRQTRVSDSRGFSIIESLVVMLLFSVVALGFTISLQSVLFMRGKIVRDGTAMELAAAKMEEMAALDPSSLSDADDTSEQVIKGALYFTRVLDVTVNLDDSRTIDIVVTSDEEKFGSEVVLANNFPLWGME